MKIALIRKKGKIYTLETYFYKSKSILNEFTFEYYFKLNFRIPWRRYALDTKEQSHPESEEEIEGCMSPIITPSIYEQETDDSDTN